MVDSRAIIKIIYHGTDLINWGINQEFIQVSKKKKKKVYPRSEKKNVLKNDKQIISLNWWDMSCTNYSLKTHYLDATHMTMK